MTYDSLTPLLAAVADPTRRAVFEEIRRAPSTAGALAQKLPVSRPAVSQHLKVLNDAGLVTVRPEGTRRIYSVRPEGLRTLREWLDGFWDDVLTNFAKEVSKQEQS